MKHLGNVSQHDQICKCAATAQVMSIRRDLQNINAGNQKDINPRNKRNSKSPDMTGILQASRGSVELNSLIIYPRKRDLVFRIKCEYTIRSKHNIKLSMFKKAAADLLYYQVVQQSFSQLFDSSSGLGNAK